MSGRVLGDPPSKLIIRNGKLVMKDGSSVKRYLLEWQVDQKINNGDAVNVVTHRTLQRMENALGSEQAASDARFALAS